jgi:hypothetical protein
MSPISSRNSVPPLASSNLPRFCWMAPVKAGVDLPRHDLLAGAVLPRDQHPAVRRSRQRDLRLQLAHDLGLAGDLGRPLERLAKPAVLAREGRSIQAAPHAEEQLVVRERLLEEVVGAELGGSNGCLDRAVARHHHDRELGPGAPQLLEDVQTVPAGHRDVEEHEVGGVRFDDAKRLLPVPGGARPVALVRQDVPHRAADALLVVHDQDRLRHRDYVRTGSSMMKRVPRGRLSRTRM